LLREPRANCHNGDAHPNGDRIPIDRTQPTRVATGELNRIASAVRRVGVDRITIFDEETPVRLSHMLQSDVLIDEAGFWEQEAIVIVGDKARASAGSRRAARWRATPESVKTRLAKDRPPV
jgi:hypothetical protein